MTLSHLFRQLSLKGHRGQGGGANKALKALRLGPRGPLKGLRAQLAIAPIGKIPIFWVLG